MWFTLRTPHGACKEFAWCFVLPYLKSASKTASTSNHTAFGAAVAINAIRQGGGSKAYARDWNLLVETNGGLHYCSPLFPLPFIYHLSPKTVSYVFLGLCCWL